MAKVGDGGRRKAKVATGGAIDVAAAAGAAVLAVPSGAALGPPLAIAGGAAALAFFCKRIVDVVADRRRRNVEHFVERLLRGSPDRTSEEVKGLLETRIEEPYVCEVLYEALRQLAETPHRCVAEALAALAAEYVGSKKEPDAFFRGLARLLADCSQAEFASLQTLCSLGSACDAGGDDAIKLIWGPGLKNWKLSRRLKFPGENSHDVELGFVSEAPRLFHMLKVHGLGRDVTTGGVVAFGGPQVVIVDVQTIHRVFAIVRD